MENKKEAITGSNEQEAGSSSNSPFFIYNGIRKSLDVSLKDRVKVLLLRKGISQNELANLCSVSPGTMSEVINGLWVPSAQLKLNMGKHLDCDSIVLFGDTPYWTDYSVKVIYPNSKIDAIGSQTGDKTSADAHETKKEGVLK